MFTILYHQHISHTRRDARQRAYLELHKSDTRVTLSPDHTIGLEVRDLKHAVAKLPEEQQSVILLVGLKGMAYAEAAAVVNTPVGTVRSRVARGRETLRAMTELFPPRHSRRPCKAAPDPQRRPAPHSSSKLSSYYRFAIPLLALLALARRGRALPLCPGTSDVNLFGDGECVVDPRCQDSALCSRSSCAPTELPKLP